MSKLILTPNIAAPDDVYEKLIGLHDGLSEAESLAANAQLILLLINHIGDAAVIAQAIDIARSGVQPKGETA